MSIALSIFLLLVELAFIPLAIFAIVKLMKLHKILIILEQKNAIGGLGRDALLLIRHFRQTAAAYEPMIMRGLTVTNWKLQAGKWVINQIRKRINTAFA